MAKLRLVRSSDKEPMHLITHPAVFSVWCKNPDPNLKVTDNVKEMTCPRCADAVVLWHNRAQAIPVWQAFVGCVVVLSSVIAGATALAWLIAKIGS